MNYHTMSANNRSFKDYIYLIGSFFIILTLLSACGNGEEDLSEWELEHGIGPIIEPVELGELNVDRSTEGFNLFLSLCSGCHGVEGVIIGPALRPSIDRRTPEFIMNYIINPNENRERHPIGHELGEQYPTRMVNLSVTEAEARTLYEYLRYYNEIRENPPL